MGPAAVQPPSLVPPTVSDSSVCLMSLQRRRLSLNPLLCFDFLCLRRVTSELRCRSGSVGSNLFCHIHRSTRGRVWVFYDTEAFVFCNQTHRVVVGMGGISKPGLNVCSFWCRALGARRSQIDHESTEQQLSSRLKTTST